jgi:hypothetical protein
MDAIATWLPPVAFVGVLAVVAVRMLRGTRALRTQGRAVRPALPAVSLFGESGASGCSEASFVTRVGGASRILLVSITKSELAVESIFPFNVFMFQNPYDIEHRVPIESISETYQVDSNSVRVTFLDDKRKSHTLRLYLKHPSQFVSVLSSMGVPSNTSLERTRER